LFHIEKEENVATVHIEWAASPYHFIYLQFRLLSRHT